MSRPSAQSQPVADESGHNALVQSGKLWPSHVVEPGLLAMILVGVLGAGLLVGEGVILSAHGVNSVGYVLTAVFVASTVSSIAGFAFSALCGALLFHLIDSPIYAVNVMVVCSIAIQMLSVAAFWRKIEWRILGVFLIGGFLGVPAGVYLLLHLLPSTYRGVIGGLLMAYGIYLLLRLPVRSVRGGPVADAGAGFLGGITGGAGRLSRRLRHHLVRPQGLGQDAPALCLSAVHPRHAAGHTDRDLSDAVPFARATVDRLDRSRLHSRSTARRVVRPAHLPAAVGSSVRNRGQRPAHRVRSEPGALTGSPLQERGE
jgi:hypothetical protein